MSLTQHLLRPPHIEAREQREMLLGLARESARRRLMGMGSLPDQCPRIAGRFGGAFVSFYSGNKLRGCVGSHAATDDLAETIWNVAQAALDDPRFRDLTITLAELPTLTIELSVLSALVPSGEPTQLVPGIHGIVIRLRGKSGCFLPKVAVEHGWSAEEFLNQCCATKAGLPSDAWRDPAAEIYLFCAHVFSERDPRDIQKELAQHD